MLNLLPSSEKNFALSSAKLEILIELTHVNVKNKKFAKLIRI